MLLDKADKMDILKKNVQVFKVEFTSEHYEVGDLLNYSDKELMVEPRFDANRTLYIAYDVTSIKHIMSILDKLNEKLL